jgi:hypothetical protein
LHFWRNVVGLRLPLGTLLLIDYGSVSSLKPTRSLWVLDGLVGQSRRPYLSVVAPIGDKPGAVDLSAMCHKRTHAPQQSPALFDHLVGRDYQASRRSQTEGFSRFAIEDGLVLRRSLDRKIAWLGTAKDSIDV